MAELTFENLRVAPVSTVTHRPVWWLGLVCVLTAYVVATVRLHPATYFGYIHDDTLYFSSAKAIAQGKGCVMPSVPGTPRATRYPELFPWILSWVWRLNPEFPGNLSGALVVMMLFAAGFLVSIYLFLQRFGGISDAEALLITGFCALHSLVLFYANNLLSDIPFAALTLATVVASYNAIEPDSRLSWAVACGILAGFAVQMRTIGIAAVAGIGIAALGRRAWRQCLAICASVGAVLAVGIAHRLVTSRVISPVAVNSTGMLGWNKEWLAYTSYVGFWKLSIPDTHALLTLVKRNAIWLLRTPSDYFLQPSLGLPGAVGLTIVLVVTGLVLAGIIRHARAHGWSAIHFILLPYTAIVLLWNFSDPRRFLLPFLPLFVAGYWLETKRIAKQAVEILIKRRAVFEMMVAVGFLLLILVGNAAVLWNYFSAPGKLLVPMRNDRASLLADKREAYDWISRSTTPDSRIIAYEDAGLYLYTGRQGMRPILFTTAEAMEPERMKVALDHMTDVAKAIGAQYWIASTDDFHLESPAVLQMAMSREHEVLRDLPVVFSSADNRVRVYALGDMTRPESARSDNIKGSNP